MHVLLLPKWYPGRNDPQLGDFIRKQALAASAFVRMSVLHIEAVRGLDADEEQELRDDEGAWELAIRFRASTIGFAPIRKAVNLIRYWRAASRGWARVMSERGRPDLLHAYIMVRPALFAWRLAQGQRVPLVLSEQSSEYIDGTYARKSFLFHRLNRFLFRRAAMVTAVSAHLGEAMRAHGLCTACTVVPNVVPGLDRPLPAVGSVGHFLVVADLVDRTKNISGVLRALAIARSHDDRAHLTIVGDGPDRERLKGIVHDLGLMHHVHFLGRVPNTEALDRTAEAFAVVVNSNVETFSVVTGEALAQGKPVIATRCGGPQAFITEVNGILIEPRDDGALAEAMVKLMRSEAGFDPGRIRDTVSERFSPAAVGRAFCQVYEQAICLHAH
ncbi:MAG: glycosyltransferase [Flavobacteriales bacterium]|jgi:glycosyltransferase involved in cell wall biosynthesis|nr:glycosyltransferase [Flavobacteriales bacterium]